MSKAQKKSMKLREGPSLAILTRRLQELPADFQGIPRDGSKRGEISVPALVFDLLLDSGVQTLPDPTLLQTFLAPEKASKNEINRLKMVMAGVWLLYDPWFQTQPDLAGHFLPLLQDGLDDFAREVKSLELVSDPDRREEFVRLCLREIGLFPAGETPEQAQDRLAALDSAERARVVKASQAAVKASQEAERKRLIKEAEERKRREAEAAATYGRE